MAVVEQSATDHKLRADSGDMAKKRMNPSSIAIDCPLQVIVVMMEQTVPKRPTLGLYNF